MNIILLMILLHCKNVVNLVKHYQSNSKKVMGQHWTQTELWTLCGLNFYKMIKTDSSRLVLLSLLHVRIMNKCVRRQYWPWSLYCSPCQHYQMNMLSGLLSLWLGWSVFGLPMTVPQGGDEGSVCVGICSVRLHVSLCCLTLSLWGGKCLK